jgi:hypothetical protein
MIVVSTILGPRTCAEFSGAGPLSSTAGISCHEHATVAIQHPRRQWPKLVTSESDVVEAGAFTRSLLTVLYPHSLTIVSDYGVSAHYILHLRYMSDYTYRPQDLRTDTRRRRVSVLASKLRGHSAFPSAIGGSSSGGTYATLIFCSRITNSL